MYTIELNDDLGDILVEQARKRNLRVAEYVRHVLQLALVADSLKERNGRLLIEDDKGLRELVF